MAMPHAPTPHAPCLLPPCRFFHSSLMPCCDLGTLTQTTLVALGRPIISVHLATTPRRGRCFACIVWSPVCSRSFVYVGFFLRVIVQDRTTVCLSRLSSFLLLSHPVSSSLSKSHLGWCFFSSLVFSSLQFTSVVFSCLDFYFVPSCPFFSFLFVRSFVRSFVCLLVCLCFFVCLIASSKNNRTHTHRAITLSGPLVPS